MLVIGSLLVTSVGFGFVTAAVLALAAVGFTLQFAVTNILNLAYGDVMTVSAFMAYLANASGAGIWLAMCVGAATGAVVSVTCTVRTTGAAWPPALSVAL